MTTTIVVGIITFLLGLALGFFVARTAITKHLKENPPINEDVIKMFMTQMGMKPSQKKINQIMKTMNKAS